MALVPARRPFRSLAQQRQHLQFAPKTLPAAQHTVDQRIDACADAFQRIDAQGIADTGFRTHHIGQHGISRAGILKQQRLAAEGLLRLDVRGAGNLQHRVHEFRDPAQFSLLLQEPYIILQTVVHSRFFKKNAIYAKNPKNV